MLLIAAVLFGRVVAQSSYAWLFEFDKMPLRVAPGWLRLPRFGATGLDAAGTARLSLDLYEARRGGSAWLWCHSHGAADRNAAGNELRQRRRADYPRQALPFLFITIACGAVSGFHALVSSGTTPKMIEQESQAVVGYAAMLLESFVGVMALIAASVLIPGDYLAINTIFPLMRSRRWDFRRHGLPNCRNWSRSMSPGGLAGPYLWQSAWRRFLQLCLVCRD